MADTGWNITDEFYVIQGNGWTTSFRLALEGHIVSGEARAAGSSVVRTLFWFDARTDVLQGRVEGTFEDDTLKLNVHWHKEAAPFDTQVGVYTLIIDKDGFLTGESYKLSEPSRPDRLVGGERMERKPDYRSLGKRDVGYKPTGEQIATEESSAVIGQPRFRENFES